ncbi:T9SS type A sorting domain-containing protein [candidate division KSB1 bacterium]|nr:T9SS type A sorting domain-containing protein [candidate division KSB1 bacterium]
MKKVLPFLLISAMVFPFIAETQEFSITIDAEKDVWYESLTGQADGLVFLPAASYLRDVGSAPDDDADISAVIWMCWDADYLYFYGEMKDDFVTASNTERYQNDCIELKFDPDPNSGTGSATSNLRLTALDEDLAEQQSGVDNLNGSGHLVDPGGNKYDPFEEDYARRLTENGYVLEFRVPLEYINEPEDDRYMVRNEGEVFGMAINLGDNDSGSRDHMLQWSAGHTDAAHSQSIHLGSITYLADHKLKFEAVSPRDASVVNDSADVWYTNPYPVAVDKEPMPVEFFNLLSNYPNPFNPVTTIQYQMKRSETANLTVYSLTGEPVKHLIVNQFQESGLYEISWNGTNENGEAVSSGTYFYKLSTPSMVVTNKMLLLK